jgi:hypothetical protein
MSGNAKRVFLESFLLSNAVVAKKIALKKKI